MLSFALLDPSSAPESLEGITSISCRLPIEAVDGRLAGLRVGGALWRRFVDHRTLARPGKELYSVHAHVWQRGFLMRAWQEAGGLR